MSKARKAHWRGLDCRPQACRLVSGPLLILGLLRDSRVSPWPQGFPAASSDTEVAA